MAPSSSQPRPSAPSERERAAVDALSTVRPGAPLALRGALLADGSGAPPRRADVLVEDGRIAAIHEPAAAPREGSRDPGDSGVHEVPAAGLLLTPGFVDIHTHSDLTLLSDGRGVSKVLQGVTCEVIGNCGLGVAPLGATDARALRGVNSYLDRDPAVRAEFPRVSDHLGALAAARPSLHVAALAAHIPLHAAVTGLGAEHSGPAQVAQIADLARAAITDGAWGVSTGLVYAPLCFVAEDELLALGEVVAETDTVFAWHVRDYLDDLVPSVEQALRVAERTGCRTQISHLQAVGRRNWGHLETVLARIDELRERGLDIGIDLYPYAAGNAPLSQTLPGWIQAGGDAAMRDRLRSAPVRDQVHAEMTAPPGPAVADEEIVISACPDADLMGMTLAELGERAGVDGTRASIDLLARHGTAVQMVAHGRSPELVERVLAHEACVVASDGLAVDPDGPTGRDMTHPRSYGTFPRYLSSVIAREGDLGNAVRRCTAAPADRLGLPGGRVVPGASADLVLLDPAALADLATYEMPHREPAGITGVLVAGRPVAIAGRHTDARPGQILSRPSPR